eukprot:gene484-22200_t
MVRAAFSVCASAAACAAPAPPPAVLPELDMAWYDELKTRLADGPTTRLSQTDFAAGTYQDITFQPRAGPEGDPARFPRGPYFLGFFAAVTIEADGVWLDLANHTLDMGRRFWLEQRFFALVQLNDRPFVPHEGPGGLNQQRGDKPVAGPGARVGAMRSAEECIVSGGVLGRSSHGGVHGNGNTRVVIERATVRDWETTGVQLNGARELVIRDVVVGPNSRDVAPRTAWSVAVFVGRQWDH